MRRRIKPNGMKAGPWRVSNVVLIRKVFSSHEVLVGMVLWPMVLAAPYRHRRVIL